MDVVTHALIGVVAASPFVATAPETAACLVLGSVAPDLDSLARMFGKQAFLIAHQTWSHALPVILLLGVVAWVGLPALGVEEPLAAPALAIGMALHALLDVTNTYGVTLLAPFTRRRFALEWVFFIDAFVLAACLTTIPWAWIDATSGSPGHRPQAVWAATLAAYWVGKAILRRRAGRLAPEGTNALLPSAMVPWTFLGCASRGDRVSTYSMNAVTGTTANEEDHVVLDAAHADTLEDLEEFRAMRALSTAYHVVRAEDTGDGVLVACRDLRTRNFATRFGQLDAHIAHGGTVGMRRFHV